MFWIMYFTQENDFNSKMIEDFQIFKECENKKINLAKVKIGKGILLKNKAVFIISKNENNLDFESLTDCWDAFIKIILNYISFFKTQKVKVPIIKNIKYAKNEELEFIYLRLKKIFRDLEIEMEFY